jgi:deoxyribonuclease-4
MQYYGAHVSTAISYKDALEYAVVSGFNTVQIALGSMVKANLVIPSQEDMVQCQELIKHNRLKVYVHMPYTLNLCHPQRLGWAKSVFKSWCEVAEAMGCTGIVMHPGSHKERTLEEGLQSLKEFIQWLMIKTKLQILLENTAGAGTACGNDVARLVGFINQFNCQQVKMTLDTCHAWAAGMDYTQQETLDYLESIKDRIGLVHANNSKDSLGSHRDRHSSITTDETIPSVALIQVFKVLSVIPHVLERADGDLAEELKVLSSV